MSLKETLSNSITFTLINEYRKSVVVETESLSQPAYHVVSERVQRNGTFKTVF